MPLLIGKRTHIFSFFFSRSSFFQKWKRGQTEQQNRDCFLFSFSLLPLVFTRFRPSFLSIFQFKNKRGKGQPEERIHSFLFPFLLLVRKPKQATAYSSPPLLFFFFEKRMEMGPKKSSLSSFVPAHFLFQKRRRKMERRRLFHSLFHFFLGNWRWEWREEKKKSRENSRLSPYCGHYRSLMWDFKIQISLLLVYEKYEENARTMKENSSVFFFISFRSRENSAPKRVAIEMLKAFQ